jgi:DNA invertase Pin-like site-specific DNA recombinase
MSATGTTPLRFAALVRVSTRKQEREGESLPVQRKEITASVRALGGRIVEEYGGCEHGTPGWEKTEFDRLLADAAAGRFDAVVVNHPDRWSRSNADSKRGLEVFRKHGILFYIGTAPQDLHNPTVRFTLAVFAEVGEMVAATQNLKTMATKRERAQAGLPVCGKLPWGRTYDPAQGGRPDPEGGWDAGWGVDGAKAAAIRAVAARYLAGESLVDLAAESGISYSRLHITLTRRCGPVWEQSFRSQGGVKEVYPTKVPPLLDDATVAAVQARARANRTFWRTQPKHRYLLGRLVRCYHCGNVMSGCVVKGVRYYRHVAPRRSRSGAGCPRGKVHADRLEECVLRHLVSTFGNPLAVQRAVERAQPDAARLDADRAELRRVAKGLEACQRERGRLVRAIATGVIADADARDELAAIHDRQAKQEARRVKLLAALSAAPDPAAVEAEARRVAEACTDLTYESMSWQDKRDLAVLVFGGATAADGTPGGVLVTRLDAGNWAYELHGRVVDGGGWFGRDGRGFMDDTPPGAGERLLGATQSRSC